MWEQAVGNALALSKGITHFTYSLCKYVHHFFAQIITEPALRVPSAPLPPELFPQTPSQ